MKYVYRLNKKNLFNCCFIYDEQDRLLYTVKQDTISFGRTNRYYDQNENEVGIFKQSIVGRGFNFFSNGIQIAELRRVNGFNVTPTYRLSNYNWNIERNFLGNEYYVKDSSGNMIMDVHLKILELPNILEVSVYDEKNTFICLMCAMALSLCGKKNSRD